MVPKRATGWMKSDEAMGKESTPDWRGSEAIYLSHFLLIVLDDNFFEDP